MPTLKSIDKKIRAVADWLVNSESETVDKVYDLLNPETDTVSITIVPAPVVPGDSNDAGQTGPQS